MERYLPRVLAVWLAALTFVAVMQGWGSGFSCNVHFVNPNQEIAAIGEYPQ